MNILKKFSLSLAFSLFTASLLTFGVIFGLYQTFSTPEPIKSALRDSGFYETVVSDAINQTQKEQSSPGQDEIPLDRPEVQNIVQAAASPDLLQSQVEGALDAAYGWLQGDSQKLEFTVALDEAKTKLADGLASYVEGRLVALPVCAPGAATAEDVDPFNTTCLPAGSDVSQLAAKTKQEILQADFLKETTVSASTIKTEDGKTLDEQLKEVPKIYQGVTWAVYGTGLLALLLAVAVVFLSVNWRSGLKKVSVVLIVLGSLSAILSRLAGYGLNRAEELAKEPLQQSGFKVADQLVGGLCSWWLWYGIVLIIIGVSALVTLRLTRPKILDKAEQPDEPTGGMIPESPRPTTPAVVKQKPKPVKKLVQ